MVICRHRGADRSQVVLEAVLSDKVAEFAAVRHRCTVVDATLHPRLFGLLTPRCQAVRGARHVDRRIGQTDADLILKALLQPCDTPPEPPYAFDAIGGQLRISSHVCPMPESTAKRCLAR
jgi:hypothetical protein